MALEWPAYGYWRITFELQRCGFEVNHKRVLRMMREDNLLCVRRLVENSDRRGPARLSPHCIEIPFAFNNQWQMPEMVGTGPETQTMADRVSGAWVAFARSRNTSHALIPKWLPYNSTDRRPC